MSFAVEVSVKTKDVIKSWKLPAEVEAEMVRRLEKDLPAGAPGDLRRVYFPLDILMHHFSVVSAVGVPYSFTFQIKYGQDEQRLVIVDAGYSRPSSASEN